MPTNSYDSAFEQATRTSEIRVEIEKLLTRGEMLEKLLECLAPFVSSPKPVGETHRNLIHEAGISAAAATWRVTVGSAMKCIRARRSGGSTDHARTETPKWNAFEVHNDCVNTQRFR